MTGLRSPIWLLLFIFMGSAVETSRFYYQPLSFPNKQLLLDLVLDFELAEL